MSSTSSTAAPPAAAGAGGRSRAPRTADAAVKLGLSEMLKGGVILDVTTVEEAKIAEAAGAVAVMALERIPSDIRKEGGVSRASSIEMIEEIMAAVSIPVMAKCRIGHFVEAEVRRWGDARAGGLSSVARGAVPSPRKPSSCSELSGARLVP